MSRLLLLAVLGLYARAPDLVILSTSVVRESHDEVELRVVYRMKDGLDETTVGAITTFGGRSTGYWSYRPERLESGTHEAVVTVGRSADAPPVYRSDAFEIRAWGGASILRTVPFEKLWCSAAEGCGAAALTEMAEAPLVERLTSVQPSIRMPALDEAGILDEETKRSLLPELAERVNGGELRVRFNAMDVLDRFGLSDPLLRFPLVDAMADPHPGISRSATALLARLATPDDPIAEDALSRATASDDASTRRYGEEGLRRLEELRKLALKPKLGFEVPKREADCVALSGRWGRFGLYQIPECSLRTPDEGRVCTDSVQCISACIAETEKSTSGACYGWTILRGTCLVYLEEGKTHGTLCVD